VIWKAHMLSSSLSDQTWSAVRVSTKCFHQLTIAGQTTHPGLDTFVAILLIINHALKMCGTI